MNKRQQNFNKRNEKIRKEYHQKVNVEKFQSLYIREQLAEKFNLDENTIYLIVTESGSYAKKPDTNQMDLFDGN